MANKKDWLNNFVEKNLWSLLVVLVGLAVIYKGIIKDVQANRDSIDTIEEAQIEIVSNQQSIIELQVNQVNIAQDISDIKLDVKTLLRR